MRTSIAPGKVLSKLIFLIVFSTVALNLFTNWHNLKSLLRPIWSTPPRDFIYIPHYYSHSMSMKDLCELHGWKLRKKPRRVFDAVIFNNELDLLEIRWHELHPYVTKFLLLESNGTFTGIPKPLWFARASKNTARFKFSEPNLVYSAITTPKLKAGEHPYFIESYERDMMDKLVKNSGIRRGDLLIMSDTDEIPSGHTVDLLRSCDGIPPVMHLQLRNYIYSFEFQIDKDRSDSGSWRSSVHVYEPEVTQYAHGRMADVLLADSGWHCSFCFKTIAEVVFKMKAYSHADRVRHTGLLKEERIQERLCSGRDLFDMLPEEYTYKELIGKMGSVKSSYTAVNFPEHLLRNAARFKYLLPGNCIRPRA